METYPFTFKASATVVDSLYYAEFGSYEDSIDNDGDRNIDHHIVTVIDRRKAKSGITVNCREEVEDLEYSIRTGTATQYINLDKLHDAVLSFMKGDDPYPEKSKPAPTVTIEKWQSSVNDVIDMAADLNLIKKPSKFRKKVLIRVCKGEGAKGGGSKIVIDCGKHSRLNRKVVKEYPRIDHDKEIGGFIPRTELDVLYYLACHETAHAIDHWNYFQGIESSRGHGSEWRFIYRQLRKAFGMIRNPDGYLQATFN